MYIKMTYVVKGSSQTSFYIVKYKAAENGKAKK